MLLKHTLLYLPAQFVGPLFQLLAMIVWTHVVDEHTLGVITLITATHELLQIGFLAWWSQYALRFLGRYQDASDALRFYRTENAVLLVSVVLQSAAVIGILLLVIAPTAKTGLLLAAVAYVMTRSLNVYIGERARAQQQIRVYTIQQVFGPSVGFVAGLVLIRLFGQSAEWPLAGYAAAQLAAALIVMPTLRRGYRLWPIDREIVVHALRYGIPLIVGGALGWVGLNASRFIVNEMSGVAAAGTVRGGLRPRPTRRGGRGHAGDGGRVPACGKEHGTGGQPGRHAPACCQQRAAGRDPGAKPRRHIHAENGDRASLDRSSVPGGDARRPAAFHPCRRNPQPARPFRRPGVSAAEPHALDDGHCGDRRVDDRGAERPVPAALGPHRRRRRHRAGGVAAASVSFSIGFTRFGLRLPVGHLVRIALATIAMAALLRIFPEARTIAVLAAHVAAGAAVYFGALALLYAPSLVRMLRPRPQHSGA